jgi:hypothetical protein
VVVTVSGEVVVTDLRNHRVCVFALDSTFRRSIGSQGNGPGQFQYPHVCACSLHRGELMVNQVGAKDAAGNFLLTEASGCLRVLVFK